MSCNKAYDKAKQLAGYALKVNSSKGMQAESHYHLARICHVKVRGEPTATAVPNYCSAVAFENGAVLVLLSPPCTAERP